MFQRIYLIIKWDIFMIFLKDCGIRIYFLINKTASRIIKRNVNWIEINSKFYLCIIYERTHNMFIQMESIKI